MSSIIQTIKTLKIDTDLTWKICVMFCLTAVVSILPDMAMAQGQDDITLGLCRIVNTLTGNAGKAVATIGVVFLGIGLFMGKMSWSVALAVGLGIAAIFGAGSIVDYISGVDTNADCGTLVGAGNP